MLPFTSQHHCDCCCVMVVCIKQQALAKTSFNGVRREGQTIDLRTSIVHRVEDPFNFEVCYFRKYNVVLVFQYFN
jgi:hypothetical protein